ncbi:MAG: PfkB family carbohydrate kinase [Acidimicrobiales bacterium]
MAAEGPNDREPTAVVFAPVPLLTVTIESTNGGTELHLHAGGQGFWQARMLSELGIDVTLCGAFGGEIGKVVRHLVADAGITVHPVATSSSNGAYVHDRRSGERVEVAEMVPEPMSRHDVDELYGAMLVVGLEAPVCVLGGPHHPDVLPADVYRRLARDFLANGKVVVIDLAGEPLEAALAGGVSVLKISDEELCDEGLASDNEVATIIDVMGRLHEQGAEQVVVSRATEPVLALGDGQVYEVVTPEVEAVDPTGGGDSLTAGIAAGLARGLDFADALRLGAAAGALNVTRRGLASGNRAEIERFAEQVDLREVKTP